MIDLKTARGVTIAGVYINTILGAVKVWVGWMVMSQSLIADGLHSLSDLVTDVAVLLGLSVADKPSDSNHPYGHHKFTTLATLFVSLVLLGLCIALLYRAVFGETVTGNIGPLAIATAAASLVIKEWLFWVTCKIARRFRSSLLLANAWHHRSDSFSSLVVLVTLIAVWIGGEEWAIFDRLVGGTLALFLAVQGGKLALQSCRDLVDTAPGSDVINDLREHILPTPGVDAYHRFRTRRVGDMLEIDLHLLVGPSLTVQEGHEVARSVKNSILEKHPEVLDVLIHLEPSLPEHDKTVGIHGRNYTTGDSNSPLR